MEIHCDIPGSAPTLRGVKKGLSSSKVQFAASKDSSKQRKKLATFDQNTPLFSDPGVSKPQTPGASLSSAKTPKSGKARRALGDISNRKLNLGESGNKSGKAAASSQVSFKVVAKPLFKAQPEYEYPDIELPAGNLGDVEDALVARRTKSMLPDDFPFPKEIAVESKEAPSGHKKQSLADELALHGGVSLLDDDEFDQFLQDGSGSDFNLGSEYVDAGPICDSSLGF